MIQGHDKYFLVVERYLVLHMAVDQKWFGRSLSSFGVRRAPHNETQVAKLPLMMSSVGQPL